MKTIKKPSIAEVEKYLHKWNHDKQLKNYQTQEQVVVKLFREMFPFHTKEEEVLVKVKILNLFYSTGILNTPAVAKHIIKIKNIDTLIKQADVGIVDKIAQNTIGGKSRRFYSFATKYCSHHNPNEYPIYDSYVSKVLCYFNHQDHFFKFKSIELKNFATFKNVIYRFMEFYNLEKYSLRELDRYLWLLGREKFPRK